VLSVAFLLILCATVSGQGADAVTRARTAHRSHDPLALAEACRRLEGALGEDPGNTEVRRWLIRTYQVAGVLPLVAETLKQGQGRDAGFRVRGVPSSTFTVQDRFEHDGYAVSVYQEDGEPNVYLVFQRSGAYAFHYRSDGQALYLRVQGFLGEHPVCVLEKSDVASIRRALEKYDPQRAPLEAATRALLDGGKSKRESELLRQTALRLTRALSEPSDHLGLLESLGRIYGAMGSQVAGSKEEPGYRSRELAIANRLVALAPRLPAARRALALAYFRIGAYPLAAEAARKAGADEVARDLLALLEDWNQHEHEQLDRFEVGGRFSVVPYRAKHPPPDTRMLFAHWTFLVRRSERPDFMMYTLASQKLKSKRHYSLWAHYLGKRTLLASYGDRRPGYEEVRKQVEEKLRALARGKDRRGS